MAVLAVFAKKHWAENDPFALFKMTTDKYNARFQRGDIVAVYDDLRWPDGKVLPPRPGNAAVFIHITEDDGSCLPALKLRTLARAYMANNDLKAERILRRAKFHINWQELPAGVLKTLQDERYIKVTLSQVKNNLRLFDKEVHPDTLSERQVDLDTVIAEAT